MQCQRKAALARNEELAEQLAQTSDALTALRDEKAGWDEMARVIRKVNALQREPAAVLARKYAFFFFSLLAFVPFASSCSSLAFAFRLRGSCCVFSLSLSLSIYLSIYLSISRYFLVACFFLAVCCLLLL